MIAVGVASKGRIHEQTASYFEQVGFALSKAGGRSYMASLKGLDEAEIWLLPADEIAKRLHSGDLHIGITGEDLLRERGPIDGRVALVKALGFARADLVVAFPSCWIDVQTAEDLRDVFQDLRSRHGRSPRVATKYARLARAWFVSRDITDFRIVSSAGATEAAPMRQAADVIVDITSTGSTLRANDLRPLDTDPILRSQAFLAASLAARWDAARFALVERVLDRMAARQDGRALVRFVTPDDQRTLAKALKTRFGALVELVDGVGEALVAARSALDVAAFVQDQTGGRVTVLEPSAIFERPNPLVSALRDQLSAAGIAFDQRAEDVTALVEGAPVTSD